MAGGRTLRCARLGAALVIVMAGCSASDVGTTSRPGSDTTVSPAPSTTTTAPVATDGPVEAIPPQLVASTFTAVTIGDHRLPVVAIADGAAERRRGLMFVEDMLDVDGMLFVYGAEQFGSFWMKDTLIPLDIAFFDGEGMLVTKLRMEPCPDLGDRCPSYFPDGDFQYALETEAGDLDWLQSTDRLAFP